MEPIPLPSHIHYELLLQLLERQTMHTVNSKSGVQEQVHQLIITLRKALAQQKHLEETCERLQLPVDYRWSLNTLAERDPTSKDFLSLGQESVGTQ
jgi:methyl coenzyme M reductase subunit D